MDLANTVSTAQQNFNVSRSYKIKTLYLEKRLNVSVEQKQTTAVLEVA